MAKSKNKPVVERVTKKKINEETAPDDSKKPARGLVVGDNFGWTGKLPVTLLLSLIHISEPTRPY